jgi:secondary thiamine-phosphate synthase enzyme
MASSTAIRPPQTVLEIRTDGPGCYEFTAHVADFVGKTDCTQGLLTLFVQHTSCSICIQENADPSVRRDLEVFLHKLVPPADDATMSWVTHDSEGPDDMPSHIKALLLPVSLSIPVRDGRLALGTWQGIFLVEHRRGPHRRAVVAHLSP